MQKQPILRLVTDDERREDEIPPELKRLPTRLREALDDYQERFRRPAKKGSKKKWDEPSQNLIAKTARVNKATLSLALNRKGLVKISAVSVIRLADVFGVNVEWLLDLSKEKENQRGPIPPLGWDTKAADRKVG